MSVQEIPRCSLQNDQKKPPCGTAMIRIGTAGAAQGVGWAWVCPECDKVPIDKSIDADITD